MSSSIPSWQILTAHAQPFRGARDLAFWLKIPPDSLPVWASSVGSGQAARMRRLAWTFAARIGDKYQIRLTRPNCCCFQVTKTKKWKEICSLINISGSASAAFTLKKNYIKYMFAFECRYDRGGLDPKPILDQMEAQLQQKREAKHRRAPSPGSVQNWFEKCKCKIKDMSRLMTKPTKWLCAQRRLGSAWASTQSDQGLRFALNG